MSFKTCLRCITPVQLSPPLTTCYETLFLHHIARDFLAFVSTEKLETVLWASIKMPDNAAGEEIPLPKTTIYSEICAILSGGTHIQTFLDCSTDIPVAREYFDTISTMAVFDKKVLSTLNRYKFDMIFANVPGVIDFVWYIYHIGTNETPDHQVFFRVRRDQPERIELRDYTAYLMSRALRQSNRSTDLSVNMSWVNNMAALITRIFEQRLLFDAFEREGWQRAGRDKFLKQVHYYIENDLPIQFALPAFPCKTTNPEKAAVSVPDGAEYEALAAMYAFCAHVERLYPHGCFVNIVSDGHVFADCQGTDDDLVDFYNHKLKAMAACFRAEQPEKIKGGIEFYGLAELLFPGLDNTSQLLFRNIPTLSSVVHPVTTKINIENDIHRQLMLDIWSPVEGFLRDLIKEIPDHALTALYRGFSRFMFEDLAHHPDFKGASVSQRKKAAEKVAFVMIQRNQTYSRLLQAILPDNVRLSIHAHDNAGPKFAVRVLPWKIQYLDSVDSLVNASKMSSKDNEFSLSQQTLHIPTPWHNTLVDVYNDSCNHRTFLIKARLVVETIAQGLLYGGYDRHHPRGGRFLLWPASMVKPFIPPAPVDMRIPECNFRWDKSLDITRLVR